MPRAGDRDGGIAEFGLAEKPEEDSSFLPQWLAITLVAISGLSLFGNIIGRLLWRRRRRVISEVAKHAVSVDELKRWFSVPLTEGPWWKVWQSSRRAAIHWLHKQVVAARASQLPPSQSYEVSG
jgi:hypothetical protein